ncbi:hypothetical protein, partial [Telmatospirillum sp.]|uniref:hypothetical protein n=1 Tax=Telmatospirillum sp. TaxID=2079197 RepID=UPI002849D6D4
MEIEIRDLRWAIVASKNRNFRQASEFLALQLLFLMGSESMGDHDSGSDDWWSVARGNAVVVGGVAAGGETTDP